jgi:cell pole-organizing protein PopZ
MTTLPAEAYAADSLVEAVSVATSDAAAAPAASFGAAASASLPPTPLEERRQPLLSPRSDAAVSGAFNQLASSMLSGSARTIDELVEDLLRPLLRSWLDMNLPPLVERLVREEIERVSRGRR